MKIIDLSVSIEDDTINDPPYQRPQVKSLTHKDTVNQMLSQFPGVTVDDLPEGNGWAIDFLDICTHAGTHLDAPFHFYPTMNGGERAWTIDEVPLEWCIGNGFVMDFSDKPDGYKIKAKDMQDYCEKVGYTPKKGDIVLILSGASNSYDTEKYLLSGVGMSRESTIWLINHGIKVMGTDAWSWDVPLALEAKEFAENGDPTIIWEGHRVSKDIAYCHIEKLTNLDKLPVTGFTVQCFPIKIKGASAGWCRALAIIGQLE